MINDLLPELQSVITSYLTTPDLCFFAQTSKRSLHAVLPLLKKRQETLLRPPQWCMARGRADISIGYTSRALYTCGRNDHGQLGLGDTNDRTTFTRVKDLPGTIQQVVAGITHTLVLTSQGLYVCGRNNHGQLGLGDTNDRTTFTRIKDLPGTIQQIIASGWHTLVLTDQGLYACGDNSSGQLGLGDNNDRSTFTHVKDIHGTIQQVVAGIAQTLVVTSQGLYACGHNYYGQLGLGDKNNRTTFTRVKDLLGTIQQVVAGDEHSLVLTSQGLYACGSNSHGQLVLSSDCTTFTSVNELPGKVQQIIASSRHTLVITDQGLYACGHNRYSQLGLPRGWEFYRHLTRVENLPGSIQQVLAGDVHMLVLTSQGLYACGYNDSGQLGLGDKSIRATFTSITCLPSELKQLLALYRQIATLITLGESNAQTSSQGVHKRKLSRS